MKALVTVKRVIDPYVNIRVNQDGSGIDSRGVKHSINPFDEIAVEEAIRLREQQLISEVVVLSIGHESNQEVLRQALALGANRAILVATDQSFCSLSIAKIIQKIVTLENPSLVLMGKQSIDGDNNQTPQMLAGLLNWPQATYATKITLQEQELYVTRENSVGLETLRLTLPAVISTDLRLNTPRRTNLMQLMQAKQKQLTIIQLSDLALELKEHTQILRVNKPVVNKSAVKIIDVNGLIDLVGNNIACRS
jgi:electron transfer flavoprotein beta subunit